MRPQAIRSAASGLTAVLLVTALLLMANWLAARHWARADWTSSQLYTLSGKTLNVLAELDQPIRVIVFMTPASPMYEQVRELLERYATASGNVEVEYIDPDRERLRTQQLAEQFGISAANTVVFSYGERTKYVSSEDLAQYDYSAMEMGGAPKMSAFTGEEEFTAAILSLVAPRVPKVYFVQGHGEAAPGAPGGTTRSLGALELALRRENMQVGTTSLLGGAVPPDADVLAVAGPTQPFTESEVALLEDWFDAGGRLLVALDPLVARDGTMTSTRLEAMLARRGVEVHDDLMIDPSRRLPLFDLSAVYLTDFREHPVTRGLEGVAVLFPVARSLAPAPGGEGEILVETSAEGWGETNLGQLLAGEPVDEDADDVGGPVVAAIAVETVPAAGADAAEDDASAADPAVGPESRLLVFGDSDFMTDAQIANAGNLTLALNAFAWLASQEASLGIAPRQVEQVNLFLSQQQMLTIFLLVVVALPAAAIVAGVAVWRRRRR